MAAFSGNRPSGSAADPRFRSRAMTEDCARHGVDGPVGRDWTKRHPKFVADWLSQRPLWWMPPGMLEVVIAEPTTIPYGYQEPDWRRWAPPYVPGRPWPWRTADAVPPEPAAKGTGARPETVQPETRDDCR
jgi:hypothetical protein